MAYPCSLNEIITEDAACATDAFRSPPSVIAGQRRSAAHALSGCIAMSCSKALVSGLADLRGGISSKERTARETPCQPTVAHDTARGATESGCCDARHGKQAVTFATHADEGQD
jgi:hypothetical protein